MGQFASVLFRMLMGWAQNVTAWLWGLVTHNDVSVWLSWLMANWLPLLAVLCLIGMAIDFIVYLIRWQPYRVWRSFLRSLTPEEDDDEEIDGAAQRRWIYADGSTMVEHRQKPSQKTPDAAQLDGAVRPVRRVARDISQGDGYYQPVYPPQWKQHQEQGDDK